MAHALSKSSFIRGVQCIKSLYLYKHNYKLRDAISPSQQAIFSRGINVGKIAQEIFPGGVDVSPESVFKYSESVEKTRQLIESGTTIIYEAAFVFNDVLAAVDMLVKRGGRWFAYEVKSSTRVSDVYRLDASLQYYVITNAGIELADFSILHLNNQYVKKGKIEPEKLFSAVSLLSECEKNQSMIADKVIELKALSSFSAVPDVKIGKHCFEPYNCDFMGQCWKNVPHNSVFELAGMSKERQFELFDNGIQKISDVPKDYSLEKNQRIQVDATNSGKELVDKTEIEKFLSKINYPVYFFDIETFMPAVPMFDGTSPFQHIPFQYSLHYKKTKDATLEHLEFLAESGFDPRKYFITLFLESTKDAACILVYNRTFESSVIAKLGNDFPELKTEIEKRLSVMIDLMEPFQKRHYYHPLMKGSHSIKNVLPAIFPDFNHKDLAISDGTMAMNAFEQLQTETDIFKIAELRDNLLAYCKLDTLAMVKIFEFLEKVS